MEPQPLSKSLADLYPPGHRLHEIGLDLAKAQRACVQRRRAVAKYPDLAKRVPPRWNGWIPPATINPGADELLRSPSGKPNGRNLRAVGESENDSPMRAELIEVVREAWKREHPDNAELFSITNRYLEMQTFALTAP